MRGLGDLEKSIPPLAPFDEVLAFPGAGTFRFTRREWNGLVTLTWDRGEYCSRCALKAIQEGVRILCNAYEENPEAGRVGILHSQHNGDEWCLYIHHPTELEEYNGTFSTPDNDQRLKLFEVVGSAGKVIVSEGGGSGAAPGYVPRHYESNFWYVARVPLSADHLKVLRDECAGIRKVYQKPGGQ